MYLGGGTARIVGGSGVAELYRTTLQRQNSDTGVEAAVKRALQWYLGCDTCTEGHSSGTGLALAVQ